MPAPALTRVLCDAASDFKAGSNKLRKKMWWRNAKFNACLVVVVIAVAFLLFSGILPDSVMESIPIVGR